MAGISHQNLIKALEQRYDFLSARAMVGSLLDGAGVENKAEYDAADVAKLAAACDSVIGVGADRVIAALNPAPAAPPAKAPAEEAAPAKEAPAAAPAEEVTEEAAADEPADDKAEKKAPAKKGKK